MFDDTSSQLVLGNKTRNSVIVDKSNLPSARYSSLGASYDHDSLLSETARESHFNYQDPKAIKGTKLRRATQIESKKARDEMIMSHSRVSAGKASEAYSRLSGGFEIVNPLGLDGKTKDHTKVELTRSK